jgi:hypothetical protein
LKGKDGGFVHSVARHREDPTIDQSGGHGSDSSEQCEISETELRIFARLNANCAAATVASDAYRPR